MEDLVPREVKDLKVLMDQMVQLGDKDPGVILEQGEILDRMEIPDLKDRQAIKDLQERLDLMDKKVS